MSNIVRIQKKSIKKGLKGSPSLSLKILLQAVNKDWYRKNNNIGTASSGNMPAVQCEG